MVTLVVHHRVHDYAAWKPVFDEHEDVRRSHGEVEHRIYQDSRQSRPRRHPQRLPDRGDRSRVHGRTLLAEAMERGGVEGEPGIGLPRRSSSRSYATATAPVTFVVHHRVHDYATWKPVFDEHEDVRRQHGQFEHRIYQTPDEPNRVVIHNDFPSRGSRARVPRRPVAGRRDAARRRDRRARVGTAVLAERNVYADAPVA